MTTPRLSRKSILKTLSLAVLLFTFAIQSFRAIRSTSPTYDENMIVGSGISFWKTGDFRLSNIDPPLAMLLAGSISLALPVRLSLNRPPWSERDHYQFSDELMYDSGNDARALLLGARWVYLAVALILGVLIFIWTRRLGGEPSCWFSLTLYAFSPTLLGYGSVVSNDVLLTLFFFLAVLAYWRFLESGTKSLLPIATLWTFLALCTKLTAFLMIPIVAVTLTGMNLHKRWNKKTMFSRMSLTLTSLAAAGGGFLVIFFMIHGSLAPLGTRISQVTAGNHAAFLLGHYSTRGWLSYYLVAIITKTTLPLLILSVLGSSGIVSARRWSETLVLCVPIAVVFAAGSLSHKQIGLRYVLPLYPFLFVLAGVGAGHLARQKHGGLLAVTLLLVWNAATCLAVQPHYLAYFNELVGGPAFGYRVLADSNLDWGQDLRGLGEFIKKSGNPEVILSYFGTARPEADGIQCQNLLSVPGLHQDFINSAYPKKELLAVSVTNLQGVYYRDHTLMNWCRQLKPLARIGYTLFVYDVTADPEAHRRMGWLYCMAKDKARALRECRRVLSLQPNSAAWYNLGFVHEAFQERDQAKAAYRKALKVDPQMKAAKDALNR